MKNFCNILLPNLHQICLEICAKHNHNTFRRYNAKDDYLNFNLHHCFNWRQGFVFGANKILKMLKFVVVQLDTK